jgi:hypothetical protein
VDRGSNTQVTGIPAYCRRRDTLVRHVAQSELDKSQTYSFVSKNFPDFLKIKRPKYE